MTRARETRNTIPSPSPSASVRTGEDVEIVDVVAEESRARARGGRHGPSRRCPSWQPELQRWHRTTSDWVQFCSRLRAVIVWEDR